MDSVNYNISKNICEYVWKKSLFPSEILLFYLITYNEEPHKHSFSFTLMHLQTLYNKQ
jgi:hypothetical protein